MPLAFLIGKWEEIEWEQSLETNKQAKQANCYYNCYFAPPVFTNDVNV